MASRTEATPEQAALCIKRVHKWLRHRAIAVNRPGAQAVRSADGDRSRRLRATDGLETRRCERRAGAASVERADDERESVCSRSACSHKVTAEAKQRRAVRAPRPRASRSD